MTVAPDESGSETGSETETTGSLLWRVTLRWRAAVDRAVAPLGLTHATFAVLAPLYGLERRGVHPSQRELADHTALEPLYVSRLVRTLEGAGHLVRARHPLDARAYELRLSDDGRAAIVAAIATVHGLQAELTAPLGGPASARTRQLRAALRALLDDDRSIR